MRVVICGAGIGGLVLAHALSGRADVLVVERDAAPELTGGYRISINHQACAVLERRLPGSLLREIRAVSDTAERFRQFTIADSQLRPILVGPEPPQEDRILAQRQALRVLLARDLAPTIRYGTTVVDVAQNRDRATVHLSDDTTLDADLVVGADGADSVVVASLQGHSAAEDLGLTGIAGWSRLAGDDRAVPAYLQHGPALAFASDGTGVFLSLYRPPNSTQISHLLGGIVGTDPALIWGTITRSERVPHSRDVDPFYLSHQAVNLLRRWHPWLSERVSTSDDRTAAFRFRAAPLSRPIASWQPLHITGLGDAIHAMPPTGGRGASTAICDAGDLAEMLIEEPDTARLPEVLSRYQRHIRPRARAAITESLGPVKIINALRHRPLQALAWPLLNAAGALGSLRYRRRT